MSRTCYCAPTLLTRAPFPHMPPLGKLLTVIQLSGLYLIGSLFLHELFYLYEEYEFKS
jgi:hypothetical protein